MVDTKGLRCQHKSGHARAIAVQPIRPAPVNNKAGFAMPRRRILLLQIPEGLFQPHASFLNPRSLCGEVEPLERLASSAEARA